MQSFALLELGAGWAPAVADDIDELEDIQAHEILSTDDRDYWIGGLAYNNTLEGKMSKYKPVQNKHNVKIQRQSDILD